MENPNASAWSGRSYHILIEKKKPTGCPTGTYRVFGFALLKLDLVKVSS